MFRRASRLYGKIIVFTAMLCFFSEAEIVAQPLPNEKLNPDLLQGKTQEPPEHRLRTSGQSFFIGELRRLFGRLAQCFSCLRSDEFNTFQSWTATDNVYPAPEYRGTPPHYNEIFGEVLPGYHYGEVSPDPDEVPPPYELAISQDITEAEARIKEVLAQTDLLIKNGYYLLAGQYLKRTIQHLPPNITREHFLYTRLQKELAKIKEKELHAARFQINHQAQNEKTPEDEIVEQMYLMLKNDSNEEVFNYLETVVHKDSSTYLKRHAAITRAWLYEVANDMQRAEEEFVNSLTLAEQDIEPSIEMIKFLIRRERYELASAFRFLLIRHFRELEIWEGCQEAEDYFLAQTEDAHLAIYLDMTQHYLVLKRFMRYFIELKQFERTSVYWLPVLGTWLYLDEFSQNQPTYDLAVTYVEESGLQPDERMSYYRSLYDNSRLWTPNGFYLRDFYANSLYALRDRFNAPDQAAEFARKIHQDRQSANLPLHIGVLELLLDHYFEINDITAAAEIYTDFLTYGSAKWLHGKWNITRVMGRFGDRLSDEQAQNMLVSMFHNFSFRIPLIGDMLEEQVKWYGEERSSRILRQALHQSGISSYNLKPEEVRAFLYNSDTRQVRFNGESICALCEDPVLAGGIFYFGTRKINEFLKGLSMKRVDVTGDGYCLWRAVARALGDGTTYRKLMGAVSGQLNIPLVAVNNVADRTELYGDTDWLPHIATYIRRPVIVLSTCWSKDVDICGVVYQYDAISRTVHQQQLTGNEIALTIRRLSGASPVILYNSQVVTDSGVVSEGLGHWQAVIEADGVTPQWYSGQLFGEDDYGLSKRIESGLVQEIEKESGLYQHMKLRDDH